MEKYIFLYYLRWDPIDGEWKHMNSMRTGRSLHEAVTCKSQVYAIGGFSDELKKCTNSVEKYDLMLGYWETIQPMKYARQDHGVSKFSIYETVMSKFIDCKFSIIDCRLYLSINFQVAVLHENIYVVGGYDDLLMSSCEKYDTAAGCWSEIINLPSPQFGNAVSFSKNLIFFGK